MNDKEKLEVALKVSENLRDKLEKSKTQCKNLEKQVKDSTSSRLDKAQREIDHLIEDVSAAVRAQAMAEGERDNNYRLMKGMEHRLLKIFEVKNTAELMAKVLASAELYKEHHGKGGKRCTLCTETYSDKGYAKKYGTPRPELCPTCWGSAS